MSTPVEVFSPPEVPADDSPLGRCRAAAERIGTELRHWPKAFRLRMTDAGIRIGDPALVRILQSLQVIEQSSKKRRLRNLAGMRPDLFARLPPRVQQLHLDDRSAGLRLRDLVRRISETLIGQGHNPELAEQCAKERAFPAERYGVSFFDVWRRAVEEPTTVVIGGARFPVEVWEEFFADFYLRLSIMRSMLGISKNDGGGPRLMEFAARTYTRACEIVDEQRFIRLRPSPRNFQVLLHVGEEPPNKVAAEHDCVWPLLGLDERTPMLFALGQPAACDNFPGGLGELEEKGSSATILQLLNLIETAVAAHYYHLHFNFPAVLAGGQRVMWWDGINQTAALLEKYGMAKPVDFSWHKIIDVTRSGAARAAMQWTVKGLRNHIGDVDVIRWFEEKNQVDFYATAERLFQAS